MCVQYPFNIIPSTPRSSKWSITFSFKLHLYVFPHLRPAFYAPDPFHLSLFITPILFAKQYKNMKSLVSPFSFIHITQSKFFSPNYVIFVSLTHCDIKISEECNILQKLLSSTRTQHSCTLRLMPPRLFVYYRVILCTEFI